MRIAHLADLHLGFRQYQRLTARGRNQREVDVGLAFSRAVDGVITQRPDAIIVAGDIFHAVRPTNSAILLAFREFSRLRSALPLAPIVVIAGNHDTPRSSETTSIFGLFHELGIHVAAHERAERFVFPELDLSVLAVPHAALLTEPRPALEPQGDGQYQVLVLHGETPGLFGDERDIAEAGGALIETSEIVKAKWSHVALGHYHVQRKVADRVWYAGALEYVSPNAWGELHEERRLGVKGKGWLLVDLTTNEVIPQPIDPPRRVIDLPALDAVDLSPPELDRLLAEAIAEVSDGLTDAVVRQVVRNVSRPVAREIDHIKVRAWKSDALHFLLDLRRPVTASRTSESGAPGSRQTLPDVLRETLSHRPLPASIDRERFVAEGLAFLESVSVTSGAE